MSHSSSPTGTLPPPLPRLAATTITTIPLEKLISGGSLRGVSLTPLKEKGLCFCLTCSSLHTSVPPVASPPVLSFPVFVPPSPLRPVLVPLFLSLSHPSLPHGCSALSLSLFHLRPSSLSLSHCPCPCHTRPCPTCPFPPSLTVRDLTAWFSGNAVKPNHP